MFYGNPCGPCANCVTSPIVHPTKCCQVNTFSSTLVPHVHPTHTTVVNHHTLKHTHLFPQSASVANTVNNVDIGPAAGIAPAPGGYGYGAPSYGGGVNPYSTMMPQQMPVVNEAYNENIINVKVTPPTYPTQVAPPTYPTYPTQVAPIPGVKEMPMYPGMKRRGRY